MTPPDKDGLIEFMKFGKDEGYFDGVEVSMEDAEIEIDGATATVYPIDFVNDMGAVTVELKVQKEKDGWLITDMDIEGL